MWITYYYSNSLRGINGGNVMLQKIIIKLNCMDPGLLKGSGGLEIHGWLFNWIKNIDSVLSTKLHNMDEKPFAIGPIYGGKKENGQTILEGNKEYSFTLSSLNEEFFNILLIMQSQLIDSEIKLGKCRLIVKEIVPFLNREGLTYPDILNIKVKNSRNITMQFFSPTSFRQQGVQEIFPQSSLVFGSLLRKWNTFSPVLLPNELANSNLLVKKFNLKTEMVDFGRYKIIGCIGTCTYEFDRRLTDYQVRMLKCLALFANVSGVGYKTSMGLGDVKYRDV